MTRTMRDLSVKERNTVMKRRRLAVLSYKEKDTIEEQMSILTELTKDALDPGGFTANMANDSLRELEKEKEAKSKETTILGIKLVNKKTA